MIRSLPRTAVLTLVTAVGIAAWTGCDKKDGTASSGAGGQPGQAAPSAESPQDVVPAGLIVAEAPADAKNVVDAKKSAKAGEAIVLRARIGGTVDPVAANRAVLTVLDSGVTTCDKMEGDACKTPWDACCEPKDIRVAKTATVQVAGADGRPLKVGLRGAGGLAPGKEVVVAGKVKTAADQTLVVDASKIYVVP